MSGKHTKEQAENWKIAARRFESLFQRLPVACVGFDTQGTIFEWNRACEASLGQAAAFLFMRSLRNVICGDDAQQDQLDEILERVRNGQSVEQVPWELTLIDGRVCHILINIIPNFDAEGAVGGGVLTWTDVSDLKAYERQIEQQLHQINEYSAQVELRTQELEQANARLCALASTDGLTGLANHRTLQERLRCELVSALPGNLSLVFLDVDHFKAFNDTFGHPQGDLVLKGVADTLAEYVHNRGLAARYGGEEFVMLLPQTDRLCAFELADELRDAIATRKLAGQRVTASFGVATFGVGCADAESLIALADFALYQSKQRGRNCVTFADYPLAQAA